jgi:hypothetical protein
MNSGNGQLVPISPKNLPTVAQLPGASYAVGQTFVVGDSTAVTTQGQTCAGGSSHTARAFSDGSTWHCSQ